METMFSNGMCRCCASEGTFKDLSTKYRWMGVDEVYSDMLQECFNVTLSTPEDSPEGGICEVCITQLRNAANFRKQVVNTEEQFKRMIQNKAFKSNIVKVEVNAPDDDLPLTDEDNNLSNDDFSSTEYDLPIKTESSEEGKSRKRSAKAGPSRSKQPKIEGESSTKPMLFKVVKTIQSGKWGMAIVPDEWERDGTLQWPRKHKFGHLSQDEMFNPDYEWKELPCGVVKGDIPTYVDALYELKNMSTLENYESGFEEDFSIDNQNRKQPVTNANDLNNASVVHGMIPNRRSSLSELNEKEMTLLKDNLGITKKVPLNVVSAPNSSNPTGRPLFTEANNNNNPTQASNVPLPVTELQISSPKKEPLSPETVKEPLSPQAVKEPLKNKPTDGPVIRMVSKELDNSNATQGSSSPLTVADSNPPQGTIIQLISNESDNRAKQGPVIQMKSQELDITDPIQVPLIQLTSNESNNSISTPVPLIQLISKEPNDRIQVPLIQLKSNESNNSNPIQFPFIEFISKEPNSNVAQGSSIPILMQSNNSNPNQATLISLLAKEKRDSNPVNDKVDPKQEIKDPSIAKTDDKTAKDEFRKMQIENAKIQRKLHSLYAKVSTVLENQTAMSSNQAALSTNFEEFMKKAGVTVKSLPVLPLDNQTVEFKMIENADELDKLEEELKDPAYAKNLQKMLSTMCFRDDGNGMAVAYKLIDAMFTREFLPKCSWGGGSREDNMKKVCFRMYQRMMNLFCNVVRESDELFTMERLEVFLKRILRNAKQRCQKLNFKPWKPQPDRPNYVPPNITEAEQADIAEAEQDNIAQSKQPIKILPKQANVPQTKQPVKIKLKRVNMPQTKHTIKLLPKQPNTLQMNQPIILLPKQPNTPQPDQPNIPLPIGEPTDKSGGPSRTMNDDKIDEQGKTGTDGDPPKRRKKKKKGDESATPERVEHRVNLTAILQYSNASPFRDKTIRGFSCLYCAKYFPTIHELRLHTADKTEKDKLNTMIDYKLSYNPIKLDITDLHCTVCELPLEDLNDLKDHLVTVHNKTIHKHIKDIILPFRLENGQNYTCVICSVVHVSFKNLYHHMSSHYRNYCCKKCGAGYITIAALRKHGKTHAQGVFPCDYCEKSYTSVTKKRNHEKGVHTGGWLRNKCPHCPQIFVSYYDRSEHLAEVHNETPIIYPCNACNKTYKKKYELNRHIRHHHLQQRSFLCDKCNAKFFSKRGLAEHLLRHSGGEACSCDICGKMFSRARTLKEHIKIHEDEKRYQCEICKKTFMQKCSLKSHVRLHQDDLDIFKEFEDVKHLIDNREMTLKQIAAENKKKSQAEKMKGQFM